MTDGHFRGRQKLLAVSGAEASLRPQQFCQDSASKGQAAEAAGGGRDLPVPPVHRGRWASATRAASLSLRQPGSAGLFRRVLAPLTASQVEDSTKTRPRLGQSAAWPGLGAGRKQKVNKTAPYRPDSSILGAQQKALRPVWPRLSTQAQDAQPEAWTAGQGQARKRRDPEPHAPPHSACSKSPNAIPGGKRRRHPGSGGPPGGP